MAAKGFQRKKEDFLCEHCGSKVVGNGYTNHCPSCLWSKHVDMHPGDRASVCGGMMPPVNLILEGKETILTHRCEKCGYEKRNKTAPNDSSDAIIALSSRPL